MCVHVCASDASVPVASTGSLPRGCLGAFLGDGDLPESTWFFQVSSRAGAL